MTLVLGAVRSFFTGRQGRGWFIVEIVNPDGTKSNFNFARTGTQEGRTYEGERRHEIPSGSRKLKVFHASGQLWVDGKLLEPVFSHISGSQSISNVTIPETQNPPNPNNLTFEQLIGDEDAPPIPTGDPNALGIINGFEIFPDKLYNVQIIIPVSGAIEFDGLQTGQFVWDKKLKGRIIKFNSFVTIDIPKIFLEITGPKIMNLDLPETFFGIIKGGIEPFIREWKVDGQVVSDFTSIDATFSKLGSHTISFQVTDSVNQSQIITLEITVLEPEPEPEPEPQPEPKEGLSTATKAAVVVGVASVFAIGLAILFKKASG